MIGALIIVFREVLEAGLIIGIVWAVARNMTLAKRWISGGILAGLAGSALVAASTSAIANMFEGFGQEIFNASILGIAVIMLAWHNLWMARHGRQLAAELRQASEDAIAGRTSFWAPAIIVCLAVLREGSEVVLFLYGVTLSGGSSAFGLFIGGLLGLAAGGLVSLLTYRGLLSIPVRHFFGITNWLITLLAAGMAAQAVSYLQQAGVVTLFDQTLWDTSWLLSEKSIAGRILHTLIGYADQPTGLQVLAYAAVIAALWGTARMIGAAPPRRPAGQTTA